VKMIVRSAWVSVADDAKDEYVSRSNCFLVPIYSLLLIFVTGQLHRTSLRAGRDARVGLKQPYQRTAGSQQLFHLYLQPVAVAEDAECMREPWIAREGSTD
jgi:hypothetical protein